MKIDWNRKLSSRKFWALLAALATSVLAIVGADESTTLQVTGVITAAGASIAYILAEGYADGSGGNSEE